MNNYEVKMYISNSINYRQFTLKYIYIALVVLLISFTTGFAQDDEIPTIMPSLVLEHEGGVRGATWNQDESLIMSWSGDGTTRIWNTEGELILNVINYYEILGDSTIRQATWNQDETLILTASFDGTARIWNMNGDELLHVQHDDDLWGASWNQDENQILTWTLDGTARVWDLQGNMIAELLHGDWIRDAYWNSDESLIITASIDNTAKVWTSDGQLLHSFSHDDWVNQAFLSKNQSQLLTWSDDGVVKIWDMESAELITQYSFDERIREIYWNKNSTMVLIRGDKSVVDIWNPSTAEKLHLEHNDLVTSSNWIADDTAILTASLDGTVVLWGLNGNQKPLVQEESPMIDVLWNTQYEVLVTLGTESVLSFWSDSQIQMISEPDSGFLWGWELNDSATELMTFSSNGTVKIWDIRQEG